MALPGSEGAGSALYGGMSRAVYDLNRDDKRREEPKSARPREEPRPRDEARSRKPREEPKREARRDERPRREEPRRSRSPRGAPERARGDAALAKAERELAEERKRAAAYEDEVTALRAQLSALRPEAAPEARGSPAHSSHVVCERCKDSVPYTEMDGSYCMTCSTELELIQGGDPDLEPSGVCSLALPQQRRL